MKNFLQLRLGDHRPFGRIAVKEEAEPGLVDPGLLRERALRRFLRGHGIEDQRNIVAEGTPAFHGLHNLDRKSGVSGKSVSCRVDHGGRRIIKKKKTSTQ